MAALPSVSKGNILQIYLNHKFDNILVIINLDIDINVSRKIGHVVKYLTLKTEKY